MRNRGWKDMDDEDRFNEADKRMKHMVERKAELIKRNPPQDWMDSYDEAIAHAYNERRHYESEASDIIEERRRKEYERMDLYGA